MPPRPFTLPLGIGTDITQVSRIRELLVKTSKESGEARFCRFLRRFLTAREQHEFWKRFGQYKTFSRTLNGDAPFLKHLCGRWAAKEAVIKAVHWRKLTFTEIQILHLKPREINTGNGSGAVYALILDKPASVDGAIPSGRDETTAHANHAHTFEPPTDSNDSTPFEQQTDDLDGQIAKISISHDGDYATAVCLAQETPEPSE